MKPTRRALQATTLDTAQLRQVNGGRGTLCGVVMHCSGCGASWAADATSGSFGNACPTCGLGIDADPSGGGGGGDGGGGGGGCGDRDMICCMC